MEVFKGTKVEIASGEGLLPLYDDPDAAENEDLYRKLYYLEAKTGQTFAVNVTIAKEFGADECDGVRVQVRMDDNVTGWGRFIPKEKWTVSQGRYVARFHCIPQYCEKTQRWRTYEYTFGQLSTSMGESFTSNSS